MRKLINFLILIVLSVRVQAQCGSSDVGGNVYQELPANGTTANVYGTKDSNEQGLEHITIHLTDSNGSTSTTTTDADGDWYFSSPSFPVRIEFSWSENWLRSAHGPTNQPVKFVSAATCNVNFGLQDPNDFSSTAIPDYVSNIKVAGDANGRTEATIQTFGYQWFGMNSDYSNANGDQGTAPIPTDDADINEVGSIWSKSLQKSKQLMFLSSVLWRHASFPSNHGLGDIYVMDYSLRPGSLIGNIDLQGVTPTNGGADIDLGSVCRSAACANDSGNTGIAADYEIIEGEPNIDLDAFKKIGKVGFGGIAMDNNTETFWAINLNQKAIIKMDASLDYAQMPSSASQYLISSIPNAPTAVGGELRPWAITIHHGKGYLGVVTDAINSRNVADMEAYILSFDLNDPMAGFTTEFTFGLDYDKDDEDWKPWLVDYSLVNSDDYWQIYNQPILTDIEFDELGNMYLAFADRFGLQSGFYQAQPISGATTKDEHHRTKGEILKICKISGSYFMEGNGGCPINGNDFFDDLSGDGQAESSNGTLALLPGSNQLLLQTMDPHPSGLTGQDYWTSHGVSTLNTTTGDIDGYYTSVLGAEPFSGKGLGMGDIEFLTDKAPIQISNRVWDDANENGIQDANEGGLEDIDVSIVWNETVLATATTDANGIVTFSSDPNETNTSSSIYDLDISSGKAYELKIYNASGTNQQTALAGKGLTTADNGEGTNPELNDSDATEDGTTAVISISNTDIPVFGANLFAKDFGFKPIPLPIEVTQALEAKNIQDKVLLTWVTSLETNNRGFEIQRSQNGTSWESIDWVEGMGNDANGQRYQVYDNKPFVGINYYRYVQVDFDGKRNYSSIVNIVMNHKFIESIYPNPSSTEVFVTITNHTEPIEYQIFNVLGEQIQAGSLEDGRIDLHQLTEGMYIIQLSDKSGLIGTFRQMHRPL